MNFCGCSLCFLQFSFVLIRILHERVVVYRWVEHWWIKSKLCGLSTIILWLTTIQSSCHLRHTRLCMHSYGIITYSHILSMWPDGNVKVNGQLITMSQFKFHRSSIWSLFMFRGSLSAILTRPNFSMVSLPNDRCSTPCQFITLRFYFTFLIYRK